MRAQDIIHNVPSRFVEATNAAELIQLASERCCGSKRVLPTSDESRAVPIRGFVCAGCGTAWNIQEPLWECTVAWLPQGYREYFETSEGIRALCAVMDAGAPGVPRGK